MLGQCGARNIYLVDNQERNLTSPGYPEKYGDDIDCEWKVTALDAPNILVSVFAFDVERGYDFFMIGNTHNVENTSTTIALLTGVIKLRTLTSTGSQLWMRFKSDRSGRRQGFVLQLKGLPHFNGTGLVTYM